jgi:RluA family pseudouridine synthase
MRNNPKKFKQPPKRFQPRGLNILYEDSYILVVEKRSGLLTVSSDRVKENTAYFLLNEYVKKGISRSKNRVFIVHRLDRDTSGVLIFAKTEVAKKHLQSNWDKTVKKYYTVVHGVMEEKEALISSYLAENSVHRMYSTNNPEKGKLARTQYKVIQESSQFSLLLIDLLTGRKNQIRVHLSEKGHPVAGDKIYGDKEKDRAIKRLLLHSAYLEIVHPFTEERMEFKSKMPGIFKAVVGSE